MTYWLDLFTGTTWKEFVKHGSGVSGFSQNRWKTVHEIKVGDRLICYVTGISRFIGILEVTGPAFQDETPIWKDLAFPARLKVKPLIALDFATAVPVMNLRERLSVFQNLKNPLLWSGAFRGSPAKWKTEDGDMIYQALKDAQANPVSREFDEKKLQRKPITFQARRNYPEHYKPWVPDTQIRRPDGYWKTNQPGPKNVVALEVELSLKTKSEYGCIGMFYRDREALQRVVWLARGIRSANTILKGIRSSNYTDPNQHLFITLPDFFKLGWQASVRLGPETGKTLSEILHGNIVQNTPQYPCTMSLLDTRKSATPTRRCTLDEKFLYCR